MLSVTANLNYHAPTPGKKGRGMVYARLKGCPPKTVRRTGQAINSPECVKKIAITIGMTISQSGGTSVGESSKIYHARTIRHVSIHQCFTSR